MHFTKVMVASTNTPIYDVSMKQCPNCGTEVQDGWVACPKCTINLNDAERVLGRSYYVTPNPSEGSPVVVNPIPANPTPAPTSKASSPAGKWYAGVAAVLLLLLVGFVAVPAVVDHLNDQAYLTTWHQADMELNGIYTDTMSMGQSKAYASSSKLATNLSIRSQYWHEKLASLPVSKTMQDSKNYRLQALTEEQAFADAWASGVQGLATNSVNLWTLAGSVSDMKDVTAHQAKMNQYTKLADESLPK